MNKYKDALNELFVYSKHIANKVEILSLIECYEKLEQLINEYFELKERYDLLNLKVIEQNIREMNYLYEVQEDG